MVDDQDVDAAVAGMQDRRVGGGAAIERDDEAGAGVDQLVHGGNVGTIALEDAVGDVDLRREAEMAEIAAHQGTGRGAVDIVIAKQRDRLGVGDGPGETVGEPIHIGEARRIGHQVADGGHQIGFGLVELDAPAGQDARQDFGKVGALRDGLGGAGGGGIEPIDPAPSGDGGFDIEKGGSDHAPSGRGFGGIVNTGRRETDPLRALAMGLFARRRRDCDGRPTLLQDASHISPQA